MAEQFITVTYRESMKILITTKKQQDERNTKNTPGPTKAKKQNLHTPGSELPGTQIQSIRNIKPK